MAIAHHPYHPTKSQPSTINLLLIIFLVLPIHMTFSLSETDALLQLKKSLQNTTALDATWSTASPPCGGRPKWAGVLCDKDSITGLRLESMGLYGIIDIEALSEVQGLRTISFTDNRFDGPIPDLNRLGSLKAIYLSSNQFSGEIPQDYFDKMSSLKKVWLSNNAFSGEIPSSLARLQSLIELRLEKNQFTGPVPPLTQPPLVALNVSDNKLEGEVPITLSKLDKGSFAGNPGLCGAVVGKDCGSLQGAEDKTNQNPASGPPPREDGGTKNDSSKGITTVATFFAIVFFMLVVLCCVMRKKKDEENDRFEGSKMSNSARSGNESPKLVDVPLASTQASSMNRKDASSASDSGRKSSASKKGGVASGMGDLVMVNEEKGIFGLQDLMKAAAEVLGNGGTGSAYKAVLSSGVPVTVKRTRNMNRLGKEEFDAEIRRLAGVRHKNLLPPLAYHYRKEEKLLVYEYKPKRSLLYGLHGDGKITNGNLDWPARRKIIHGTAQGLGFLHTELSSSELPHGNLKSSNILIKDDNEPVLAEYGFSSITSTNQTLLAYRVPEVIQGQKVSPKCDVYCFGVVILETLTGKFPSLYLPPNNKGGVDVAQWVVSAIEENREAELLDPQIAKDSSHVDEMVALLRAGATCVEPNPDARPDMLEAIKRVENV